jgi:hypothetical protein
MKNLFLGCLVAVILVAGCSTKISSSAPVGGPSVMLEQGQKILIAVPADGVYGNTTYTNSGREAASRLQKSLTSKASTVLLSKSRVDVQAAIKEARAGGYRYVFYPEITHWEHRNAAWSGRPTKVSFYMQVYDLKSGADPVLQRSLDARGRIMTFVSQFPADIAEVMFQQFVDEIF